MIKLSEQENKTDRILYLYRNERGHIGGSYHSLENTPHKTMIGTYKVSPKEQIVIQNFEYPHQNQDDFFIEDFMRAYISRMYEILLSEGMISDKFIRFRRKEKHSFIQHIETMVWDPGKGKEVKSSVEQKVSLIKSKLVFTLKETSQNQ